MSSVIKLDGSAQAHIQAYLEYKNIVGDTDGGKLLSEKEYAKRKKKAMEDQKNRIYVTWLNENNLECRAVGPSSKCFCGHKFRDHDSCNKQKNVYCKILKCKCKLFEYIPIRGSQDLKCHCKHSYKIHNISTRKCCKKHPVKGICVCLGFISSFGCSCGLPFSSHHTLFETRAERQKTGKRVDNLAMGTGMGCAAMGGITTFSSLLDGVDRMSIQPNKLPISNFQMQFMKPRNKFTEEEEMELYARKYQKKSTNYYSNDSAPSMLHTMQQQNKSNNMANKLKLLKKKRSPLIFTNTNNTNKQHTSKNNRNYFQTKHKNQECDNFSMHGIQRKISEIETSLKDPSLSAPQKYALNKSLKVEKSKIIRRQRKMDQDKRIFEAGL